MGLVPLPEWGGVNLDDTVLDQCLGPHQLVVGGVVDHVQDSRLACHSLRAPGEVAVVQPECTVLPVASSHTHDMDPLRTNLGGGGGGGGGGGNGGGASDSNETGLS